MEIFQSDEIYIKNEKQRNRFVTFVCSLSLKYLKEKIVTVTVKSPDQSHIRFFEPEAGMILYLFLTQNQLHLDKCLR